MVFENQTEWIVQNENEKNIVFVAHLGDIVNNSDDYQWHNADNAMSILDNKVPYGLLPGNHDMPGGSALEYENYFPASRYEGYSYWGGKLRLRIRGLFIPQHEQLHAVLRGRDEFYSA